MAYCKIHVIRATVSGAIKYITAPGKTDPNCLISSFACSPETAADEFSIALSKTRKSSPNKAYHLIQSFCPGEVTATAAHQIGKDLADELLTGKYSYVIATHTDWDHIHNHIIFCAADNIDHRKFHSCKQSYQQIKNISDRLCAEHNLSVIGVDRHVSKSYKEWSEEKKDNSWKSQVRKDINAAIRQAFDYENFLRILREQGYQIRGEDLNAASPKYISFLPPGKDRWVRGRASTLGEDFTRERIHERIMESIQKGSSSRMADSPSRLVVMSEETLQNKPYLRQWANKQNLKVASEIYTQIRRAGYASLEDALSHLATNKSLANAHHSTAQELDKKLRELARIIRYTEQYQTNLPYKHRYSKSKDPDGYLRRHETEISLCEGAEYMLKKEGIDPDKIDLDAMRADYEEMKKQKDASMKTYAELNSDARKLEKLTETLEHYLERENRNRTRTDGNDTLS